MKGWVHVFFFFVNKYEIHHLACCVCVLVGGGPTEHTDPLRDKNNTDEQKAANCAEFGSPQVFESVSCFT